MLSVWRCRLILPFNRRVFHLAACHSAFNYVPYRTKLILQSSQRVNLSKSHVLAEQWKKPPIFPISESDKLFTIPNILTFGRIFSTPVITYCVVTYAYPYALGLFFVAGVSDIVDGYIARNFKGQSSVMGSVLDPLADKILVTSLSLSLAYVELLPVWLVSLILFRDFCLVVGAFYLRHISLPEPKTLSRFFDFTLPTVQMKPLAISKFNTGIQLLLIISHLSAPVFGFVESPYLTGLCYFTALTTFSSGISYIFSKDTFTIIGQRIAAKKSTK